MTKHTASRSSRILHMAIWTLWLLIGCAVTATADWVEDGKLIYSSSYLYNGSRAVTLSNGDVAVVSTAGSSQTNLQGIMLQRISPSGDLLWGNDGLLITSTPWFRNVQEVIADGSGGLTIFWTEEHYGESSVNALHVSADGSTSSAVNLAWASSGIIQWCDAVLSADGSILVAWNLAQGSSDKFWITRVTAYGQSLWAAPILVSDNPTGADERALVVGIDNGAILVLGGDAGGVSAVRVSGGGQMLWQRTVQISPEPDADLLNAAPDGFGGAFVTWRAQFGSASLSCAQHISASGVSSFTGGRQVLLSCTYPLYATRSSVVAVAPGRALFQAAENYQPRSIRRAVLDTTGALVATASRTSRTDYAPTSGAWKNSQGHVLEVFPDYVHGGGYYCMRGSLVTAECKDVWNDPMGTRIARHGTGNAENYCSAQFADGSYLIAWTEASLLYATRRMPDGYFESPAPIVTDAVDIGDDEGGYVTLGVNRSRFDSFDPLYTVTSYAVWRSRNQEAHGASIRHIVDSSEFLAEISNAGKCAPALGAMQVPTTTITDGLWELVGYFPAMQQASYRVVVPTYADSTAMSAEDASYCVSAHTPETAVYYVSEPIVGHSVDNRAPTAPAALSYAIVSGGYRLTWSAPLSADLAGYNIYGSSGPEFAIQQATLLGTSSAPQFDLTGALALGVTHCRITAVDRHGNESAGSAVLELSALKILIADVPNDQGGALRVSWPRHVLDVSSAPGLIVDYRVQREQNGWQTIATLAAAAADSYAVNVVTPDIETWGQPVIRSHFRVIATGGAVGATYVSPPDSAASIDNLPPAAPGLAVYDTETSRTLVWQNDSVGDLGETCLYRGFAPGFEAQEPVMCSLSQIWYLETHLARYYYRARSRDIHGNLSAWSSEAVGRWPTGTPNVVPAALRLYPCRPNPFNPRTTIKFDLPAAGVVRMAVFDVAGRLVRLLVDQSMAQGTYDIVWDGRDSAGLEVGSGSYLARLEFDGKVQTIRMGLVR